MNYSGLAYTLGLGVASVGGLFVLLSPFLGWIAVFLSGSDTSGNALFGNLQVVAARQLGLNPVLFAATNSSGGVMGKMISPQNIATGVSVTELKGREGAVFARTFLHSVVLTIILGLLVALQQYVIPWIIPARRRPVKRRRALVKPAARLRFSLGGAHVADRFPPGRPDGPRPARGDRRWPGGDPPRRRPDRRSRRAPRLRDRRLDRLSARAACRCAATLDGGGGAGAEVLPRRRRQRRSARRRHVAFGGAIPQEDAIVIGLSKMSRILEVNLADRYARVEAGVTNLAISEAVAPEGFFYAPDPSSQLACTIGGNVGMNSGGAHCLKYGATINNMLGVRLVTLDGDILEIGGAVLDAPGLDWLGLVCGSEGQLGVITEVTVRLLALAEGARPVLFGFDSAEDASQCVAAIIGAGVIPVAMEYMDRPAIEICENFAHAGYPLDVEAMLAIVGGGRRDGGGARPHHDHRQGASCARRARIDVGDGKRADMEGPQIGLRRDRPRRRLHLHGRHRAGRLPRGAGGALAKSAPPTASGSPTSRRRWQHASADPL